MNLKTYVVGFINNFQPKNKEIISIKNLTSFKRYNLLNKNNKQLNKIKKLTFLNAVNEDAGSTSELITLTTEQKEAIRKILASSNNFDLSDSSLQDLDMPTLIDEVFGKEEELMKEVEFFKKGDVLEISFLLKHSGVKVNSSLNNPFANGIVQSPNANVSFLNRMNYLSKKITLNYIIYEATKGFDYYEVASQLCKVIWSNQFRNLTSSCICLESVSLKTVYPRKRITDSISIGVGDFGAIRNSLKNVSGRPFVFSLGTRFIKGDRDAFTVRWFFLDKSIKNPYEGLNDLQGSVPIQDICNFFREPVSLVLNNDNSSNKTIILRLAAATTRRKSPFPYAPVTKVWATGFLGNTQGSSILIPIDSSIELPIENGQIQSLNQQISPLTISSAGIPPLNISSEVNPTKPINGGGTNNDKGEQGNSETLTSPR